MSKRPRLLSMFDPEKFVLGMYAKLSSDSVRWAKRHPVVSIGRSAGKSDDEIIALLVKILNNEEVSGE